jgi:quinol monooxygenase YgiN
MNMATVVFINRLQPADGQRDALIGLQREFADSIHADPESLHYSVHEPIDDEAAPLTVIQAYTSVAGFEKHGEWMAPNIPRLVALLASPARPSGPAPVGIAGRRSEGVVLRVVGMRSIDPIGRRAEV